VPRNHKEDGISLGIWISIQRTAKAKGNLSQERLSRLTKAGFCWDDIESKWQRGYESLVEFSKEQGHCKIPTYYSKNGFNLGVWSGTQRANRDKLSESKVKLLNRIGFVWAPFDVAWELGFQALVLFSSREGHCDVPKDYLEGQFRLGRWIRAQRSGMNQLDSDRVQKLLKLGFAFSPLQDHWKAGLHALTNFHKENGHCCPPINFVQQGFRLGKWVLSQRTYKPTTERISKLNDLGFVWNLRNNSWNTNLEKLIEYKSTYNDCLVPVDYTTDNIKLGRWVVKQRSLKESLSRDRISSLDEIGFVWNPFSDGWEKGMQQLQDFKSEKGHCKVPTDYIHNGFKLGNWVQLQRGNAKKISPRRKERLNQVGFIWNAFADQWDHGYKALKQFRKREGHCKVPIDHVENGVRLGGWVSTKRLRPKRLLESQKECLDALGFIWDVKDFQWEEKFEALKRFRRREGHCNVKDRQTEGDIHLGSWVYRLKKLRHELTRERIKRLNKLGFNWHP